ncbi:MAG: DNA repair protein RadA [Desulfobacteraceae bacterium]|nr:DNA repair protein RadA [Desulfobacteraceae bacterium]
MKTNKKQVFRCQSCGSQSPKWMGKCPDCGQWDSFVEEARPSSIANGSRSRLAVAPTSPIPIDSVELTHEKRLTTHIAEFDRVLGGGLVTGSLVLIGGDPGIGKSTLMLQAVHRIADSGKTVLYISGEESVKQLRLRAKRLNSVHSNLLVISEIDLDAILSIIDDVKPAAVVVDSIQTMYSGEITSAPGSVSQVRESAMRLMLTAKRTGVPIFIVGHVTKEGVIAGPRLLEHMVDTVLYFEGDRNHVFRILRAVKNRFGSTNEIGVFEMKELGLEEVANPSAVFLAERPDKAPGSVVTASMEGTRPILVEIQALTSNTNLGTPRRTVLGLDQNRVSLLVAVMEKKIGLNLLNHDIFMNVVGGVKVDEPAVDMAVVAAIASSFLDRAHLPGTLVMGETGLTGEIRAIGQIETRIAEARKMGFSHCIVPKSNLDRMPDIKGIEIVGVGTLAEAMEILF